MASNSPNPIDIIVGQNIRFQRLQKGLSQEAVADRLGLTFQQVQKYEKGTNRTSASRLVQLARIFGIGITPFFDGVNVAKGTADLTIKNLLTDPKAMELLEAFVSVEDKRLRGAIVDLVLQLTESK